MEIEREEIKEREERKEKGKERREERKEKGEERRDETYILTERQRQTDTKACRERQRYFLPSQGRARFTFSYGNIFRGISFYF